jgi:voltage-gated potassium channel
MDFRQKVAFYLEDIDTRLGRGINLLITGLVLVSSAIFVLETYGIPKEIALGLKQIETVILVLFVVEYGVRFWVADRKVAYLFSLYSLIDLLTIVPFLLGAADVSFLRIFRWFRILRLVRFVSGRTRLFGYVSGEDGAIAIRILFTLVTIIFVYSGLIYQAEHPKNPQVFHTFLDAVYFSLSTLSTAGMAQMSPVTQLGRLLTVLMLLTGIVLIPLQLGDLLKRLVGRDDRAVLAVGGVAIVCDQCGVTDHPVDAKFCRTCGTGLAIALSSPVPSIPGKNQASVDRC